jgi:hypothetical protein
MGLILVSFIFRCSFSPPQRFLALEYSTFDGAQRFELLL